MAPLHHGILSLLIVLAALVAPAVSAEPQLPPEEAAIKDTVDHWGLAFSDQLRVFEARFPAFAEARGVETCDYVLGVETPLRKTFQNKYWFKGKTAGSVQLAAARNEWEQFQLAILPKTGFTLKDIRVAASALTLTGGAATIPASEVRLWRVGFVKTRPVSYPVRYTGEWPDVLGPLEPFELKGLDLGLIWCEIHVPADAQPGDYTGTITVTPANSRPATLTVKLHVWRFALPDRVPMPMIVWMSGRTPEFRDVAAMFLAHHMDPVNLGNTNDLKVLDENLSFGFQRGLMVFQTAEFQTPEKFRPYYEHIREKGWVDKALVYCRPDEPTEKQLQELNIPFRQKVRRSFPNLKVFLATQYYPRLDEATDVWLCDLSTNYDSWRKAGRPGKQQSWWYFCHLPIRTDLERPLVDAPNMLIDNDAIEHRLPYWMAFRYGVKGLMIWAGTREWPKDPKDLAAWQSEGFPCGPQEYKYPYGGWHNGNGYLLYPGPLPSIRLKVLRDGAEDYAYLLQVDEIARSTGPEAKEAQALLEGIQPAVFVDTHYFSRDPDRLLAYRMRLAEFLDRQAARSRAAEAR